VLPRRVQSASNFVAPPFGSSAVSPSVSIYRKERSAALRPRLAAGLPLSSGAEALARRRKGTTSRVSAS
jgi:hypothetical protein